MSRYLERAEHSCRLLAAQFETLEDRAVEEVDRNWRRVFSSVKRVPSGGELQSNIGGEDYMLVDSFTLADELTFEPTNPNSIRNCISTARENARQVRHVLGKDMWSNLNAAYLNLKTARIENFWNNQPRKFYLDTGATVSKLSGIMENSMYRDHGWHFAQLGRFVERLQIIASLLDAQIEVYPTDSEYSDSDWNSLLKICEARLAYSRLYSLAYQPDTIVNFLVSDPQLSHSIRYALTYVVNELGSVTEIGSRFNVQQLQQQVESLMKQVDDDWPNRADGDSAARSTLQNIHQSSCQLNDEIGLAYFYYNIESAL